MKFSPIIIASALSLAHAAPASDLAERASLQGLDVSGWQTGVNWASVKSNGASFAIIKATEGTDYKSPEFNSQYIGSYDVGLIRGAYHFARPDVSTGAAQAEYFATHGGGWSADGKTLPGTIDLEWGASSACYGLSQAAMVNWITDFVDTYHAKTSRWPIIYTATSWWTECTGNTPKFSTTCPLFVAHYANAVGELPAGWPFYTFWQYADSGKFPGDQDTFNGGAAQLKKLATN